MIKVIVIGAAGRMGGQVIQHLRANKNFKIVAAVEGPTNARLGEDAGLVSGGSKLGLAIQDSLEAVIGSGDVVIDFSHHEATVGHLRIAAHYGKASVVGTTGHTAEEKKEIEALAQELPLVMAPNMSIGVNVMWKILTEAARILGPDFHVGVREVHHIHKKDKPSGTALQIVHLLSETLGLDQQEIVVESVREGEVVGDHTTRFEGPGESLEITHRATSRDPFVFGALRAAEWVANKPNGLYSMVDVLGIR